MAIKITRQKLVKHSKEEIVAFIEGGAIDELGIILKKLISKGLKSFPLLSPFSKTIEDAFTNTYLDFKKELTYKGILSIDGVKIIKI